MADSSKGGEKLPLDVLLGKLEKANKLVQGMCSCRSCSRVFVDVLFEQRKSSPPRALCTR
jgi:hypothetical protein